jgi:hypothetical protein
MDERLKLAYHYVTIAIQLGSKANEPQVSLNILSVIALNFFATPPCDCHQETT